MKEDIEPRNDKGQQHGYWENYWDNGNLMFRCVYINGQRNGIVEYHMVTDGKVTEKYYHL